MGRDQELSGEQVEFDDDDEEDEMPEESPLAESPNSSQLESSCQFIYT